MMLGSEISHNFLNPELIISIQVILIFLHSFVMVIILIQNFLGFLLTHHFNNSIIPMVLDRINKLPLTEVPATHTFIIKTPGVGFLDEDFPRIFGTSKEREG